MTLIYIFILHLLTSSNQAFVLMLRGQREVYNSSQLYLICLFQYRSIQGRLFLRTEVHCVQGRADLSPKRHTCSPRHFQPQPRFFTGIRKRQLHQQRSHPERGERDGRGKKGGRCTRKQWLYLELVVHVGIDKQSP